MRGMNEFIRLAYSKIRATRDRRTERKAGKILQIVPDQVETTSYLQRSFPNSEPTTFGSTVDQNVTVTC